MTTQSEAALESGLIKTLVENSYERVIIREEENLKANFKAQLEKYNLKQLQQFGRSQFTDKEFEKILICLEGGTRFEKAKKNYGIFTLWKRRMETESGSNSSTRKSGVKTNSRQPIRSPSKVANNAATT